MALVSVVIPAFQAADTIAEAVRSVLEQDLREVEIVVVDDGSTDDLEGALRPFGEQVVRIRQPNQGAAAARNNGARRSSGEILAFLDADDAWLPGKLARQLPLFEKRPEVGVVFGDIRFRRGGEIFSTTYFDLFPAKRGKVFLELFACNFVPTSSVLVRRSAFEEAGGFDASIRYVEDYDLWLRLAASWEFDFVPEPVAHYRVSAGQVSPRSVASSAALLRVKERSYRSQKGRFVGAPKGVLEKGLHKKVLSLAIAEMRDGENAAARKTLDDYERSRGRTAAWFLLRCALRLPGPLVRSLVSAVDAVRRRGAPPVGR